MIDRRTFIGTFAGGILAAPLASFAQQPTKVPRIGVIGGQEAPTWDGLRQGLRELGYVDGRSVAMDWRWSEGKTERLPTLALELVQLKVDIIVAAGTQATRATKDATSTIPIVMAVSAYPDKIGLVESLARPGGNVTGLSNVSPELFGKRLQLLKEISPKVSRVAVLWFPESPAEALAFRDMQAAFSAAGLEIQSIEMRTSDNYNAAFATATERRADALYINAHALHTKNRQLIADFALKSRLPSMYEERVFVVAGASCHTRQASSNCSGVLRPTSTRSSRARSRGIFRSNSRPNSSWSSTSRPPRYWASRSRRRCCSGRTR